MMGMWSQTQKTAVDRLTRCEIGTRSWVAVVGALVCFGCDSPQPPEACGTIPDQVVHVNETVTARACFDDPDGDLLRYTATASDPGVALVRTGAATLEITGLVPGNSMVSVTATDASGLMAVTSFTVQVPNRSPIAVGTIASLVVSAGDSAVVDAGAYFADPDGQELVHAAVSSDTSVASVAGVGAVFTVSARAKGLALVTVTASDPGGLTATQSATVTIPNRGPAAIDSLSARTLEVGETVTRDVAAHFSDPDGDSLSFAAASADVQRVTVSVSGSTVAVTALKKGTVTVTVTATDTEGMAATLEFAVIVPNRPPVALVTVPADTLAVGDSRKLSASSLFADPDGDTLLYAVVPSDSTVVTALIEGDTVTVTAVAKGEAAITVTATDTEGLAAVQSFTEVVPNRAPVAEGTIRARTIEVGDSAVLDVSPFFSDPDADGLFYSATVSDSSVTRLSVAGASVHMAAIAKGETTVTITAADPEGLSVAQSLAVVVPNQPPLAQGDMPSWAAQPGDSTQIDLARWFTDPDGDVLLCTATVTDTTMVRIEVSGTALTIAAIAKGEAVVLVTATDGEGLAATHSFAVTVHNQAPIPVGLIENRTVDVGDTVAFVLSPFFIDYDGDALTFEPAASDSMVARVSVAEVTLTVAGIARGATTVAVTATDAAGLAATQTFGVTVPNRMPVAIGTMEHLRMNKSGVKRLTPGPYFADPDDDSLVFEATSSDLRVAKAWVWTDKVLVRAVGGGTATVTILGRDPEGLSAQQTIEVRVRGPSDGSEGNRSPVVRGSIGRQTLEEGDFRNLAVASRFSDPDGDELRFSAESSDTAVVKATISGTELVLRAVAQGAVSVRVTARDPGGLSATVAFGVTVSEASGINRAPVAVGSVAARLLTEGDSTTLSAVHLFVDPDNDDLTFAATSSDTTVVTSSVFGSEIEVHAVAPGVTAIEITARDPDGLGASLEFEVTVWEPGTPSPICDRTQAVRNKILALVGASGCAEVTSSQLAWVTVLELQNAGITSLKSGDFAGLSGLSRLQLYGNELTSLPSDVFSGLSSLTSLQMSYNRLTSLPSSVFSGLRQLEELNFSHNEIESFPPGLFARLPSLKYLFIEANVTTPLPSGLFSGLSSLEVLFLYESDFGSLPEDIFSGLSSLSWITLEKSSLDSLRADTFEDLSSLSTLNLNSNRLTALPPGIFADTPGLTNLLLGGNKLEELPDSLFDGLSSLRSLWLHGNKIDPIPIEVSLIATSSGDIKAAVSVGAPFPIEVSLTTGEGTTDGVITIPVGALESPSWDPGGATSVNIAALPVPPTTERYASEFENHPAHHGYILKRSPDLPLKLGEDNEMRDEASALSPYATPIDSSRNTSWIRFSSFTPSDIGLWNAFRPEIKPIPPARLLITAVRAACAKSLSPLEPPELISPMRPM